MFSQMPQLPLRWGWSWVCCCCESSGTLDSDHFQFIRGLPYLPFMLIEEAKAPRRLRVCSPRRVVTLDCQHEAGQPVSSGLSAQSSDCTSVPKQQGTSVQHEPSRSDGTMVFGNVYLDGASGLSHLLWRYGGGV